MKVLLINPPISSTAVYGKYSVGAPCLPPLGLCYLAAVLLKNGSEVRILDCPAEGVSFSQLKEEINRYSPEVVGVTSTTVSYPAAKETLKVIKETDQKIKTILGGAHISALPFKTMEECADLDIGVIGEGEETLMEVIEKLNQRGLLRGIKGILYREGSQVVANPLRQPIKDLDQLPLPARQLLKDLRLYSHTPFRGSRFNTSMITSRGCPFNCSYCDQSIFGRTWRAHSPDYVLAEILQLKKEYGVEYISFEDDNFLLSRKRALEICRKLIEKRIGLEWDCLARVDEVDKELLLQMKKAGCKYIYIGIESGSPRILELINKRISILDMEMGVRLIKDCGIGVYGSFMLGLPTETEEDIEKTIELALSLPLDGVSFFLFTPYPNTKLGDNAWLYGTVSNNWGDYSAHPTSVPFIPKGLTGEYLLKVQAKAYRRFFLRPNYIIHHLDVLAKWELIKKGLLLAKSMVFGDKG